MGESMAEYEPGKMKIDSQVEMYNRFWSWTIRIAILVAIVLAFLYLFRT